MVSRIAIAALLTGAFLGVPAQANTQSLQPLEETSGANPVTNTAREWRFRVLLNDKDIGYHSFRVSKQDDAEQVEIEASFDVRILFINAYSYRHKNVERWTGECLSEIRSSTEDGGESFSVTGEARENRFVLDTNAGGQELASECVRTFAYWDPRLLDAPRLLNAQTGEWVDVQVADGGMEQFQVNGESIESRRYLLQMPEGTISLWYGTHGRWLALEAPAPGGRTLKYVPERLPPAGSEELRVVSR
jgi:hypothetical protein